MIGDAIEFVRKELRDYLGMPDEEVLLNTPRKLIEDVNATGVLIALVNVQEETALRNTPTTQRIGGIQKYKEPPVFLNVHLLFAFQFQKHETSLLRLSQTVEFFQHRRWFNTDTLNTQAFPANLEKLNFEMVNLNFEEVNNLWGVLGGSYLPSVVYKMRMVKVEAASDSDAPIITGISVTAEVT